MNTHESLRSRALRRIPGGVNSPVRAFKSVGGDPIFAASAAGAHITTTDGRRLLDFCLSFGPMLLGHAHPAAIEAIRTAATRGTSYAVTTEAEIEMAELICEAIPVVEKVRLVNSGTEAVMTALRLARGFTGRSKILKFSGCYHGHVDQMLVEAGSGVAGIASASSAGVTEESAQNTVVAPYNDFAAATAMVERHGRELALIAVEPVAGNMGLVQPAPGYLKHLRTLADSCGALLLFDEVITGFRVHLGGAQAYYGVTPDLAVFAKAIANGYPISVLAGKRKWMQPIADGRVIHAGTANAGNPSIAAALATINVMERERAQEKMMRLGLRLKAGLQNAVRDTGQQALVQGPGAMVHLAFTDLDCAQDMRDTLRFDKQKLGRFVLGLQENGVRILGRGMFYVSAAHTEQDVDHAVDVAKRVLAGL